MKIFADRQLEFRLLEEYLSNHGAAYGHLEILEAGCGRAWPLKVAGVSYTLTGLDLDPAALEARKSIAGDLTHGLVGDLRTATLESGKYDVIYSSYVLEHVPGAEQVLCNFVRWLKPGGLIIIRIPDRDGVHGFMARITPFWLHVLHYRYVQGHANAGKPGYAPYPTAYDRVISRQGIRDFAAAHDLMLREEIGTGGYAGGRGAFKKIIPLFAKTVSALSLRRVHAKYTDITFVLQKRLTQHQTVSDAEMVGSFA